jgi:hypothetical protein
MLSLRGKRLKRMNMGNFHEQPLHAALPDLAKFHPELEPWTLETLAAAPVFFASGTGLGSLEKLEFMAVLLHQERPLLRPFPNFYELTLNSSAIFVFWLRRIVEVLAQVLQQGVMIGQRVFEFAALSIIGRVPILIAH